MNKRIEEAYILLKPKRRMVGVKLVDTQAEFERYEATQAVAPIPYCVAVKAASLGHAVKFTSEFSGCGGSTRTLGLKEPEADYYSGESGQKLGLYSSVKLAAEAAEKMKICPNKIYGVVVKPIENFETEPDVVLVIADSRTCMRVVQGYTYYYGLPENISLSGNQAVCVEATVIPHLTGKINVSLLCSGTRYLAKWDVSEMMVGIPGKIFHQTVEGVLSTVNAVEPDDRKRELKEQLKALGISVERIQEGEAYYLRQEREKKLKRREKTDDK